MIRLGAGVLRGITSTRQEPVDTVAGEWFPRNADHRTRWSRHGIVRNLDYRYAGALRTAAARYAH